MTGAKADAASLPILDACRNNPFAATPQSHRGRERTAAAVITTSRSPATAATGTTIALAPPSPVARRRSPRPRRGTSRPEAADALPACCGRGRGDRLSTAALFLAAGLWLRAGRGSSAGARPHLALPLWSATPRHLERLALAVGPVWLGGFLTAVTDAAQRAGQELTRLQIAERARAG